MPQAVGPDPARRAFPSSGQPLWSGFVRRKRLAGLHGPPDRSNQTGRHRPFPILPCTPSKQSRKSINAGSNSKRTSTVTLASVAVPKGSSCTRPSTVRPSSCPSSSTPSASKFASASSPVLPSPRATDSSKPWSRVWTQPKPGSTASPAAAKLKPPDELPAGSETPRGRGRNQSQPNYNENNTEKTKEKIQVLPIRKLARSNCVRGCAQQRHPIVPKNRSLVRVPRR